MPTYCLTNFFNGAEMKVQAKDEAALIEFVNKNMSHPQHWNWDSIRGSEDDEQAH